MFTTENPQSVATFLVDSTVAGKWRVERAGSHATLLLEPFERLPASAKRAAAEETAGLVRFMEPDAVSYAVRAVSAA